MIGDAFVEIPWKEGPPLTAADPVLETSEDRATAELAETLLNDVRKEALPALRNLSTAAEASAKLASDLQDPKGDLKQAIAHLNKVIDKAEKGDGLLARLLNDKALAEQMSQTGPKVNVALDETNQVMKQLPALVKQMEQTLADVQVVLKDLQKSTGQLPQTVKSINQTVEGLPSLVLQTQETLRQMQRLVEGVQRSWLVRGSMDGESSGGTGRINPDRVGGGTR